MEFINHMKTVIVMYLRKNEVVMDKPFYCNNGFAVSELNKLHMYETYYDKLQPCFGQKKFNYTILILMRLH